MTPESRLLIALTRAAVTGTQGPLCLDVNWDIFLKLAKMHKMGALAYDGLLKSGVDLQAVPQAAADSLRMVYLQAISKSVQTDTLRAQIKENLLQRQVAHIFLKGSVLKYSYPVPALRTMTDMDILVYTKDYPAIEEMAQQLGGKPLDGDGNHKNYCFPGNLKVEFHPNLLHHDTPIGTGINPGWQYAKAADSCSMELSEEGMYLHTLCHLAEHFASGGIGVRYILDVWVFRHLRSEPIDRVFVEQELEKFGLLEFARNMENLAELWFGSGETSDLLEELGEYVLTSGSHGTNQRAVLNTMSLSAGGTARSAILSKVFYSREEMEDRFPWVKGKPWLLPAAWCVRAFRVVTRRRGMLREWTQSANAVSEEEVSRQKERLDRFGIRRQKK